MRWRGADGVHEDPDEAVQTSCTHEKVHHGLLQQPPDRDVTVPGVVFQIHADQ